MLGKKVRSRAIFIFLVLTSLILTAYILFKSLEENVVYFLSPTEIYEKQEIRFDKRIRIGGMVKKNTIKHSTESINFIITDFKNEIYVIYSGSIPNLFAEEKGVVAEGFLKNRNYFLADKILAKHDENYMPPEVNEALMKESKQ
jgi:cytochrome c-type biogenesis protein CcmE